MSDAIRLFLIDDHTLLRSGLKLLLKSRSNLVVIGEAGDVQDAYEQLLKIRVDILILDIYRNLTA